MTLAEKCCTSPSYIGQIEIGNRFPSIEMIEKIASALNIKPHLLFIDESSDEKGIKIPAAKQNIMSDKMKDELVRRISDAVRRVVKRID